MTVTSAPRTAEATRSARLLLLTFPAFAAFLLAALGSRRLASAAIRTARRGDA